MRDLVSLARWTAASARRPSSLLLLAGACAILVWVCSGLQEWAPDNALAWPLRVWFAFGAGALAAAVASGRRGSEHAADAYVASRPLARGSLTRWRALAPLLPAAVLFLGYMPYRLARIERHALDNQIAASPERKKAILEQGRWMNTGSWDAAARLSAYGLHLGSWWHDYLAKREGRFDEWRRKSFADKRKELAKDGRLNAAARQAKLEEHRRWLDRLGQAVRDYARWKREGGPLPRSMHGAWFTVQLSYAPYLLHCAAAFVLFALGVAAGLGWSAVPSGARGAAASVVRRHLIPLAVIAPSFRFTTFALTMDGDDAARGALSFGWSLGSRLYVAPGRWALVAAVVLAGLFLLNARAFRRADLPGA